MSQYLIACDEGTSSARSVVFDSNLDQVAHAQEAIATQSPYPGWIEQDPLAIWHAQLRTLENVINQSPIDGKADRIAGIGITNQRETTLVWSRDTGEPIAPAIVWQCRRTTEFCTRLKEDGHAATIRERTGLEVDPYFSASKINWILNEVSGARSAAESGKLAFGTVDSWLVYRLTDGATHIIDRTNASRTMLMNLETNSWDPSMLDLFEIPTAMLPEIVASKTIVGNTAKSILNHEIPIAGIAGDQQAALFGHACQTAGSAKNTYGTGCFFLLHSGNARLHSRHRLLETTACDDGVDSSFALEGSVFDAGTSIQWLRDSLGLFDDAQLTSDMAFSIREPSDVMMVPAFSGLGAPYWQPNVRGLITGLNHDTSSAEIIRAALHSIAFQSADLVRVAAEEASEELVELNVDGGASANDYLIQFQADILNLPVVRPADLEVTARGAAALAGMSVGMFTEIKPPRVDRIFEPQLSTDERKTYVEKWHKTVKMLIGEVDF